MRWVRIVFPLRYGLFSFVAQVDNPTVSFFTGTQSNTIYWPDGQTQGVGPLNSRTLTGITAGDALTVQLEKPLKFGFTNIQSTGGLGDFEVFWEALVDSTNIELKDYGITRPILNSFWRTWICGGTMLAATSQTALLLQIIYIFRTIALREVCPPLGIVCNATK
jgi:hypothetical protein